MLPTGATLNKNGAAVYKAVTAVFIAHLYGVALGPSAMLTIVLVSTVAAFSGAGVPGSSLVTTLIVLNAIGLGPHAAAGIALVVAVDRPLDMCRSMVNTIGNLVGCRRRGSRATRWLRRETADDQREDPLGTMRRAMRAPGDVVVCNVDWVLGTDASSPMAIDYFEKMGGETLFDPSRVLFAFDHYSPPRTRRPPRHFTIACARLRGGTAQSLFEVGEGISFQLLAESGRRAPGRPRHRRGQPHGDMRRARTLRHRSWFIRPRRGDDHGAGLAARARDDSRCAHRQPADRG